MNPYLKEVEDAFKSYANPANAAGQKAYMRNQFEFLGLASPLRRELQKPFLRKENLPDKKYLSEIVKSLWNKPQREFQYFAMEMALKYSKQLEAGDIDLFEWMVIHKSWWDTVDNVAPRLMGEYFNQFRGQRDKRIALWLKTDNIWLKRSALLFQLKYKAETDTEFLTYVINNLLGSKEFFINKAIGWVLREYSKTNPQWVIDFVKNTALDSLSEREALKVIKKNAPNTQQ